MKIKIQQINTPNKNNRVYSQEVIEKLISDNIDKVIFGTIGFDYENKVNIENISHTVANLRIEDDYLVGW